MCCLLSTYSLPLHELRCWKHVAFKALLQICIMFWALSKPAQDGLLWSLQSNSIEGPGCDDDSSDSEDSSGSTSRDQRLQHHVKWFIGGTQVCRNSFQKMLGVGCGRLNRTRKTFKGYDERQNPGGFFQQTNSKHRTVQMTCLALLN